MSKRHEQHLLELTGLPTAAGLEHRVIDWIHRWARRRKTVTLTADAHGNLTIKRKGARSAKSIYFTAHLDHPAFAVTETADDGRHLQAEFRGGVHDDYFKGTAVTLHREGAKPVHGKVVSLDRKRSRELPQLVTIKLDRFALASPGDLMTWKLPKPVIRRGRLHAPACDDLAAVAAAISAYEKLLARPDTMGDVRLLFTRAEEVGFVGAIAAAKTGTVPKGATLVCLENSKSMVDSPIGAGPIIRVGDRMSIFDPSLTARFVAVASDLAKRDKSFKSQRKLMPGGACEATAFCHFGYLAGCLCLPLGNYHNMDEAKKRIAPESISVSDYHQLIALLVAIGRGLGDVRVEREAGELMRFLYERGRGLLG